MYSNAGQFYLRFTYTYSFFFLFFQNFSEKPKQRRQRCKDPSKLDINSLTGEERVPVVHKGTGRRVSGSILTNNVVFGFSQYSFFCFYLTSYHSNQPINQSVHNLDIWSGSSSVHFLLGKEMQILKFVLYFFIKILSCTLCIWTAYAKGIALELFKYKCPHLQVYILLVKILALCLNLCLNC